MTEFKQDEYLLLEKYEDYYMGAPSIDKVTFRIISDLSAQEVALMNGEVNFMELANALMKQWLSTRQIPTLQL